MSQLHVVCLIQFLHAHLLRGASRDHYNDSKSNNNNSTKSNNNNNNRRNRQKQLNHRSNFSPRPHSSHSYLSNCDKHSIYNSPNIYSNRDQHIPFNSSNNINVRCQDPNMFRRLRPTPVEFQ